MEEMAALFPEYSPQSASKLRGKPQRYTLTPVDVEILTAIYHLRFMTSEQVLRYRDLSKNSLPKLQEKLQILSGNHPQIKSEPYLQRFYQARYDPRGSLPFVYALDTPGKNYLRDLGLDVTHYERVRKVTKRLPSDIDHHLAINEFFIAARHLHKHEPRISLVDSQHDWKLKHSPLKVTVYKQGQYAQQAVTHPFVSDGLLEFQVDLGDRIAPRRIFLEMDMGTHERHEFKKKLAAYIEFFSSGAYVKTFGNVKNVSVLYATPDGEKRRDEMLRWTREQFERPLYSPAFYLDGDSPGENDHDLFLFASLPKGALHPGDTFLNATCSPVFGRESDSLIRLPKPAQKP